MARIAYRVYSIYLKNGRTRDSRPVVSLQNPKAVTLEEYKRRYPESAYDYEISKAKLPEAAPRSEDKLNEVKWTSRKYAVL